MLEFHVKRKRNQKYRQVHDQLPISFFTVVRVHETKHLTYSADLFESRDFFKVPRAHGSSERGGWGESKREISYVIDQYITIIT